MNRLFASLPFSGRIPLARSHHIRLGTISLPAVGAWITILTLLLSPPPSHADQLDGLPQSGLEPSGTRLVALDSHGTPAGAKPELRVRNESDDGLEIDFDLPALLQTDFEVDGQAYDALAIEDGGFEGADGAPMTPAFTRLIAIPDRAGVRVEVTQAKTVELSGHRLLPMQPEQAGTFARDEAAYTRAGYPAMQPVTVGEPALLRGVRVVPITFRPVRFDPAAGKVEVAHQMKVRVTFAGSDLRNAGGTRPAKLPASFEEIYAGLIVNARSLRDGEDAGLGTYVIICQNDASVLAALQPLIEWRRHKGYEVVVATTAETGTTNTSIRNWLRNAYNTWENPPEYIALIGDGDNNSTVRIAAWSYGGGDTDFPYTQLDGDDILGDAHVGRISVRDIDQLTNYVAKIVSYESDPYLDDLAWYTRGCVTGDRSSSGYTCVQIGQWLKTRMLASGYTAVDTVFNAPFVDQMNTALRRGDTAFMYRGYVGMSGFDAGDARAVSNGRKMPFTCQITCGTNSFAQDIETVCEAWIRSGTAAAPKGAVGAVGASTWSTHTRYNNCATYGIFAGIYNEQLYQFGAALTRGKYELYLNYSNDTGGMWNFTHWINLIGDPAGELWTGVPQAMSVTHPGTLALGANAVTVEVTQSGLPLAGATVCLYRPGAVQVVGFTNADGTIELPLSADAGTLDVTVTKHNCRPYRGTIEVASQPRFAGYLSHALDDDRAGTSWGNDDGVANPGERIELAVQARNFGTQAVAGVSAQLSCDDPYISLQDASETLPDLAPGASGWTADDFDFALDGGAPNGHLMRFDLDVASGADSWRSLIEIPVVAAEFHSEAVTLYGFGTLIDPGEQGELSVRLRNTGGAVGFAVNAKLLSGSSWVTVLDSLGTFGDVGMGSASENTTNRFGVRASSTCVPGHVAAMKLCLEFSSGARDTADFTLSVGQKAVTDPTGPDRYGYYAFDNSDTQYPEAPVYSWVEIDPRYGGQGVSAGLNDNTDEFGDSETHPLPFSFRFYGQNFSSVTIASDGWIAMGRTYLSNYNNWTIPGAGAPPYMIAPKWDGLYQVGEDRVYQWFDDTEHRYVVQWSRMRNDATGATENFEVVLYDPAYYPTATGDGLILFQYQAFSSGDFTHNYWTTGIENGDQTDGVLYAFFNTYTGGSATIGSGRAILFVPMPLTPWGTLSGTVTNASAGGIGIPQATVTIVGRSILSTQENGQFVGNIPVGTHTVIASHPSFAPDTVSNVSIVQDQETVLDFSLVDIRGPLFTNTTDHGGTCDTDGPYEIFSTVTEYSTIEELTLTYCIAGAPSVTVPLELQSGNLYRAEIPGAGYGSLIRYYLRGRDNAGNLSLDPPGAPNETYSFWVIPPILEDDIEAGAGNWSHYRVQSSYIDQWHRSSRRNHTSGGSWSWKVGDTGSGNYGQMVDAALQTEAIELDGNPASLTFWHWMRAEDTPQYIGQAYDGGMIEISLNGGAWTQVTPVSGYTHTIRQGLNGPFAAGTPVFSGSFGWIQTEVDLSNYTGSVRLRFRFGSDNAVQMEGWYIDDVVVMTSNPGPAGAEPLAMIPERLALHASPNPFARSAGATLAFDLPNAAPVRLDMLDVTGRLVRTLFAGDLAAGRHRITWDGRDGSGRPMASGVYLCLLRAGSEELTRRVLVVD